MQLIELAQGRLLLNLKIYRTAEAKSKTMIIEKSRIFCFDQAELDFGGESFFLLTFLPILIIVG